MQELLQETPLKVAYSAKDEGLGACAQTRVRRRMFLVFPIMVESQVMKLTTKNQFCFLFLITGRERYRKIIFALTCNYNKMKGLVEVVAGKK